MTTKTLQHVVEEWFDRLWRKRDVTAIDDLRHPDSPCFGVAPEPLDLEKYRKFHALVCATFDKIDVAFDDFVTEGHKVAIRMRFMGWRGKQKVEIRGMGIAYVIEGRVARSWNLWDVASFQQQLGRGPDITTLETAVASLQVE